MAYLVSLLVATSLLAGACQRETETSSPSEPPPPSEAETPKSRLQAEIDELKKEQEEIRAALEALQPEEAPSTSDLGNGPRLTRKQITNAIGKARPSIKACGEQHDAVGVTVKVAMSIGSDGVVTETKATGGSDALNACTAEVVEAIVFPESVKGMKVTYPFVFR